MFFSEKNMTFRVLDVLRYKQENTRSHNRGRHFAAVSFRLESDAEIFFEKQSVKMQKGSVSYFPADLSYSRVALRDEVIAVHLEIFGAPPRGIESFVTAQYDRVRAAFEDLESFWRSRGERDSYAVAARFAALFDLLHRESLDRGSSGSDLIERAMGLIRARFSDPECTVTKLAGSLFVSPEYLRRAFRRNLGTSPKEYLQSFRLKSAASLLLAGDLSVKDVASRVGFADEKYFSVAFRRATGTSPSRYRYSFSEEDLLPR